MINPFQQLFPEKEETFDFDEWGGQFSCQEHGCDGYAFEARYEKRRGILVWKCADGHTSSAEVSDA